MDMKVKQRYKKLKEKKDTKTNHTPTLFIQIYADTILDSTILITIEIYMYLLQILSIYI